MSGLEQLHHTFFDWGYIKKALPDVLSIGLPNTLLLAAYATVIGVVIGLVVASGLLSHRRWLRWPCRWYVDILRGLPHILTIYVVGQGLPLAGISIFGNNTYGYAALAIGLVEGSYMAEIFRSGFQSVDPGQVEAARSLGLSYAKTMRFVIVPNGIRRVLPALTGQFILTIKGTALVYLLGLTSDQREMFAISQDYASNDANLSALVAAGVVYLAITIPLTYAVNAWERRLNTGPKNTPSVRMDDELAEQGMG